jgi:putative hemolysin
VFPVNDILLYLPNLKELFIPINKHGNNTENVEIIQKTFDSEKLILYFPAGLVSRKQKSRIMDLEWKKTFISKAIQYQRDIIPVYIEGRNSSFFYRLANLRKSLKIKANIEMLLLPDEMYKQKNKNISIYIGKPIPYQTFDHSYSYNEWAQKVKRYVYKHGEKGFMEDFNPEKL